MKKKVLIEAKEGIPEFYFDVDAKISSNSITIYDPETFTPKKSLFFNLSFNHEALMDSLVAKGIFLKDKKGKIKVDKYGGSMVASMTVDEILEKLSEEMSHKIVENASDFVLSAKEQIFEILSKKTPEQQYFNDGVDEDSLDLTERFFNLIREEGLENSFRRAEEMELPLLQTRKLRSYIYPLEDGKFTTLSEDEKQSIARTVCQELFFAHRDAISEGNILSIWNLSTTPVIYDPNRIFMQKRGVMVRYRIITPNNE
jgi:hypothetical protein